MNEKLKNLIDSVLLNDCLSFNLNDSYNENLNADIQSQALTDYLTSGPQSQLNNDVVKIIAAAMQIASEIGILEIPAKSTMQTAMAASNILNKLNLSYLAEQGEIMATEIVDSLIDQTVVNTSFIVETILQPDIVEEILDYILDSISATYPPVFIAAQFAKQFTEPISSFISKDIKPIIKEGINTISNTVKNISHSIISKSTTFVAKQASKIGNKLISIFS